MLTLRNSAHVRTSRNIKGQHACPSSTGLPLFHVDGWRIARANIVLAAAELRREWLAHLWMEHRKRCGQHKPLRCTHPMLEREGEFVGPSSGSKAQRPV